MLAERAGVLTAIAAVLVLVGELAGAVVLQDRMTTRIDPRIEALQVEAVALDQVDVPAARANIHAALHSVLNRAGY